MCYAPQKALFIPFCTLWAACFYTCLPLVSRTCLPHLSPTLGALGCVNLHLSPSCLQTCLPRLSPTLVSYACLPRLSPTRGCLGRMVLHLPPATFPLVSHSECSGPHDFTLVSHLSICLGYSGPHDLTLASHLSLACLPLLSQRLPPTCLPLVPHLSPALGAHVPHSSPTLDPLGRMSFLIWPAFYTLALSQSD